METRLRLQEHEEVELSNEASGQVFQAIQNLSATLKPRRRQVARVNQNIEVRNFVGSVRLPNGTVLEVEPKVPAESPWAEAVVQLITDKTRISVTGSQRSRLGGKQRDLAAVIAFEFARRLESALRKEGPIQVFERQSHRSRRINGQLDVGSYARNAWRDPTMFPVQRDELTVVNDFSIGLSLASRFFRRSVNEEALSARLRRLESAAIPGSPLPTFVNPAAANRQLPPQWIAFKPAWDIAASVLRNQSIINDPGQSVGLEVAVEPWPLLETLLERTLDAIGNDPTNQLNPGAKTRYALLKLNGETAGSVIPDGILTFPSGELAATFEAKYTRSETHPKEAHRYQALSTAAVLHSPNAVLVYPGNEQPKIYEVQGFGGYPKKLATIGMHLFDYRSTDGAKVRAEQIMNLLMSMSS